MIHLCEKVQEYKPCPEQESSPQYVTHNKKLCPYHDYLYHNPESTFVPKTVGKITSTTGACNSSADAERRDHEGHNQDLLETNGSRICETCLGYAVYYFSPMEECAGRITIDRDGKIGRYGLDAIDEAVETVAISTIFPPPPPPMSRPHAGERD